MDTRTKRLIYFSPYDLLRPRTNQISDVRFCEAFAENNLAVELIVPTVIRVDNLPKENILKFYDVQQNFGVHFLDANYKDENISKLNFLRLSLLCLRRTKNHGSNKNEVLYIVSRSEILLLFTLIYKRIFFKKNWKVSSWLHELKSGWIHKWVYRNSDFVLATNSSILNDLKKQQPKETFKTAITYNPISQHQSQSALSKIESREKIKYTSEKPLIVYTGKLFIGQHEIKHIIEAARELTQYEFIFTGGKPNVVAHYNQFFKKNGIINIQLTGYINDYRSLKHYQKAADLLISYYTTQEHDTSYNLPNKFGEYMISGNPIITPFFKASQDLIKDDNAFQVAPENTMALIEEIQKIFQNPDLMKRKADNSYVTIKELSYNKVAKSILTVFKNET